jgi:Ca2+-binding EF-hand superfamily protein
MTDDDIRNMIEEADLDNDGKVSFEEFKKLLMR